MQLSNNPKRLMAATEGSKSRELLEAQSHVWNDLFSFIKSMSLKCCVQLGIPDAVHNHGKPINLTDLAAALSIPPCRLPSFKRLMTFLSHMGYFTQPNEETYALTPNSALLVKGQGHSITPFIELILDQHVMDPYHVLGEWFKCDQPSTAFEKFHGTYVWNIGIKYPDVELKIMAGLGSDAATVAKVIVEDCTHLFQGVKSLVEVAGGTGEIARAVAKAFPHIKCSVLDFPQMIKLVDKDGTVDYVAGDMFSYIPPADALILKWVLMTWSDEECVKILKRCKEATPSKENGGKVIIIEKVIKHSNIVQPKMIETQLLFDIHKLIYTTGKQRTEEEWKKIFVEAGFKEFKITPALGLRCIIELYH